MLKFNDVTIVSFRGRGSPNVIEREFTDPIAALCFIELHRPVLELNKNGQARADRRLAARGDWDWYASRATVAMEIVPENNSEHAS